MNPPPGFFESLTAAAVARTTVHDPVLLLCDEPTGDLASENSARVMDLLRSSVDGDLAEVPGSGGRGHRRPGTSGGSRSAHQPPFAGIRSARKVRVSGSVE
ncbi:hypothetical protein GCM10022221_06250 [Actinocorallia aurea]